MKKQIITMGIMKKNQNTLEMTNRVYDSSGVSPTLCAGNNGGGKDTPKVVVKYERNI